VQKEHSMDDEYSIIIFPAAETRLYEHVDFRKQLNEAAAERLEQKLLGGIHSLHNMPDINGYYDDDRVPPKTFRKLLIENQFRIVFRIIDDTVYIYDIQDCRQSDRANLI
jgi:plasmid stabilization system protein ParE